MNKDLLKHMIVLDRTMFATEMKDKAYVLNLDMLSTYDQDDLLQSVFVVEETLARMKALFEPKLHVRKLR